MFAPQSATHVIFWNQGSGADEAPVSRAARLVADLRQLLTLKQHYYPEGGWGWVILTCSFLVHVLNHGFLTSAGLFYLEVMRKFGSGFTEPAGWFGGVNFALILYKTVLYLKWQSMNLNSSVDAKLLLHLAPFTILILLFFHAKQSRTVLLVDCCSYRFNFSVSI